MSTKLSPQVSEDLLDFALAVEEESGRAGVQAALAHFGIDAKPGARRIQAAVRRLQEIVRLPASAGQLVAKRVGDSHENAARRVITPASDG